MAGEKREGWKRKEGRVALENKGKRKRERCQGKNRKNVRDKHDRVARKLRKGWQGKDGRVQQQKRGNSGGEKEGTVMVEKREGWKRKEGRIVGEGEKGGKRNKEEWQ